MNSQMIERNWCFPCIWLFVLFLAAPAFNTCAFAQDRQSTSIEQPSGMPEVVGSIAELQKLQLSDGHKAYKVDLEAQLIFAAPYWTVFFVQDGEQDAMISCTDAASWVLIEQKVGCKVRVTGIAGEGPGHIIMSTFEVTDSKATIEPTHVENLAAKYVLPLNRFAELSSEVKETFVSRHGTILSSMEGDVPVELEINEPMDVSELLEYFNGTTIASGCLSFPPEPERKSTYVLRIMSKGQVRNDSRSISAKQLAKRFKIHAGKVVYTDSRSEFVVESNEQVQVVESRFAFRLIPGDKVLVHELTSAKQRESPLIESSLIEMISNEPLSGGKAVTVTELLNSPMLPLPNRVLLTGKLESMAAEDGTFNFKLTSQGVEFYAKIPEGKQSLDMLGVRVGDLVSLTGAPLLEESALPNGTVRSLKLYVASVEDLKYVSTPVRVPFAQIATIVLAGSVLLGSALTWNWLLRRQVQLRTARLNEVTSHLRKAFEAVHEGVLVNDCEQRITGFNQQFANLFDIQPVEGQSVNIQLSAIEDRLVNRVDFARIRQHIQDNKSPSTGIIELRSANRTLQVFASAITDNDGSYQGNLWSFEDVTEKLSLENKLIQSQKMEAVGQLSGGIAHDFNNLLTIIRGSLMMMKLAEKTNAPSTEFAESAEIAVDRAAELTQHLLDFSRRSTLQLQTIDANDLLKRVYLMIRRSIDSSIEINFESSPQPIFISVDVTRLEQVLINLCINARDALPLVGGRIQLDVMREELTSSAVIVVKDNGSGISPEVQKRMFEPFFTTKQPGSGTGLGLSMAIGVVEQLGGRIECRSELGHGTAFQISLPCANPNTVTVSGSDTDANAGIQPLRILLVDDEEQIRKLGNAILKSLGHQTVTAANGREAIDVLATDQKFDVVLLDLTMPVMSGKEAFKEIRRRWPKLPIAICSGYLVSVEDWVDDNLGTPPTILTKPYRPDELNGHLTLLVANARPSA